MRRRQLQRRLVGLAYSRVFMRALVLSPVLAATAALSARSVLLDAVPAPMVYDFGLAPV